jgi:hypothetical protein
VSCSPKFLPGNADRGACNVLKSTLSPAMGRRCGRRERGTDAGGGGKEEQILRAARARVVAVKGTLIRRMSSAFAGRRNNASLGRSVSPCRGLVPRQAHAPATTGVLWENEEGNVVSVRQAHALFVVTPKKRLRERGHVLHSVQRPVHVNRH